MEGLRDPHAWEGCPGALPLSNIHLGGSLGTWFCDDSGALLGGSFGWGLSGGMLFGVDLELPGSLQNCH